MHTLTIEYVVPAGKDVAAIDRQIASIVGHGDISSGMWLETQQRDLVFRVSSYVEYLRVKRQLTTLARDKFKLLSVTFS